MWDNCIYLFKSILYLLTSLDGWKLIVPTFAVFLVVMQLRTNRRGAKDKLIYDLNRGLESYGRAVKYCEFLRSELLNCPEAFSPEFPYCLIARGGKEVSQIEILKSSMVRSTPNIKKDSDTLYASMRNMLRAFETIMLMLETRVVKDSDIFPLVGYRIELLANCPIIQSYFLFSKVEAKGIKPNFRFAAVFALYHRMMVYHIGLVNEVSKDGKIDEEQLVEDLLTMRSFELSQIDSWIYEHLKIDDGKEAMPISTLLWEPAYQNEFHDRLRCKLCKKLSPYELCLHYYYANRPRRPKWQLAISDFINQ